MLRTFKNSKGEQITVNREHLEKALDIKIQLQKLSPSNKANWSRLIEMMHEEGYAEAEKTESYRLMIKDFQRDLGKLTKNTKKRGDNAQMRSVAIQNAVGDLYFQKRALQIELNKLNKLKREMSLWSIIADEIKDAFLDELDLELPQFAFKPKLPSSGNKAQLIICDWHVGAVVDNCDGNYYNYEILKKRIDVLKQKTLEFCMLYGITDLNVISLGDLVEHCYMRNTQSHDVEFNFSTQIVKATELIIDLLVSLSQYLNITFTGIAGNHDRIHGIAKNDNLDGDNAIRVINYAVAMFIEASNIPRIRMAHNSDDLLYSYSDVVNGKRIKYLHGDLDSKKDGTKIDKHNSIDKNIYDAIVFGHLHHYSVTEKNMGAMEIYCGSPMGRNTYGKKMKQMSEASQTVLIITEEGDLLPQRVNLQSV
jgi:predicted phosphodiesterase